MTRVLHVLHIGKTGGSALQYALQPFAAALGARFHGHDVRLRDVPRGEKAMFLVREPVSRFVSGFNSRLRKGRPLNDREWSEPEARTFQRFPTPNALAEALGSPDGETREAAAYGMGAIYHPARPLSAWLESADYLAERRDDIVFVGLTDHLDQDFARLRERLGLPGTATLPTDIRRHATPAGFDTRLSEHAETQIRAWYANDFPIYAACVALHGAMVQNHATVR